MEPYLTGATVKRLREEKGMTQAELAARIGVSDKAVSRWENAHGLPDITLIEPIAAALGVSVSELMSGTVVRNGNVSGNLLRSKIYVCPVCGNVIRANGEAVISCCGIPLPAADAEEADGEHTVKIEPVEDEIYVTLDHPMSKSHYISFIAYVTADRFYLQKLYPEGAAEARFKTRGHGYLYFYCNHHGLMKTKI